MVCKLIIVIYIFITKWHILTNKNLLEIAVGVATAVALDNLQPVAGALLVEMPQIVGGMLGSHKELGVEVLDAGGFAPALIHLIGNGV